MISTFRSFAKSPAAIIIIALLVMAFAFYGVGGIFTGSGTAVAIVGKEQVSVGELSAAYDRQIQNIQVDNPEFTREQAREFGLGDQVLDQLIVMAAFSSKAREMGLVVADRTVVDEAARIEAFRSPITGRFDPDTMREILSLNGYTEAQFENEQRGNILRAQLTAALGTGIGAPDELAQTRFTVRGEQRAMRGLFIDSTFAEEVAAPDDATLESYIESNRGVTNPQTGLPLFLAPEMRRITLVRFQVADFINDVEVDEAPLRELYDYQLETNQLGTPALRTFSQVNAPDEATANAIAQRIGAGEDAAAIASELGLIAPFEQADVQAYEVPDTDLSDAVFAASVGEAIAVEGSLGWYAVHITGGVDGNVPSFEEELPGLREDAAQEAALNAMYDVIGRFSDARDQGASLEDAAETAGTPIEFFPAMDRYGRDASLEIDMNRFATLGQEILPFAFEQFEGIDSDLEQFNETDFFVVRVEESIPEQMRPLEDIRDIAEAYWRVEQIDAQLQARADEALAQLQAGEDIDLVALTSGGRVETATLTREQTAGLFSQGVVSQAFNQSPGEFGLVLASTPGVKTVVVVDDIILPDAAAMDADTRDELDTELLVGLSGDILLSAQNALISEYGLDEGGIDPRLRALALGESDTANR